VRVYRSADSIAGYLTVACVCASLVLCAQIPSQFLVARDTSFRESFAFMMADAEGGLGSPVLDRRFYSTLLLGGHLTDEHTSSLLADMKEVNRAGFYARGGLTFYSLTDTLFGRTDWGLQVSVNSSVYAHGGFSSGLFETIFKGNGNHAGDTLFLGPFSGQYQSWQKFGVGLFNKKTFSGGVLSLVTGQDYRKMEVRNAGLYTSPLADSLVLYYAGEFTRSDTANRGWGAGNGIGLALDLEYNRPLASGDGFISIAVRDFGWVAWNKATQTMRFDTSAVWRGYSTDQLFSEDGLPTYSWRDSLGAQVSSGIKWRMLPFSVNVRMMKYFSQRSLMDFSIALQPGHFAVPLVQAGISHFVNDRLLVTGRLGAGGLGRYSLGAECQWMPKGRWYFRAGVHNAPGWISPKSRSTDAFGTIAFFIDRRIVQTGN